MKDYFNIELGTSKKNIFEGYFFNITTDYYSVAIIVGYATGIDKHSFIYINDSKSFKKEYKFKLNDFKYSNHSSFQIKDNYFSKNFIILNLPFFQLKIDFSNMEFYKEGFLKKTIMGPFEYIPMKCKHRLIVLNGIAKGYLQSKDEYLKINGKIYIEKDLGKSFPREYVWVKCNNFRRSNDYFFFSWARLNNLSMKGFICYCNFNYESTLFSSYNLCRCKIIKSDNKIIVIIKRFKKLLEFEVFSNTSNELLSPDFGEMKRIIKESLDGFIRIKIFKKSKIIIYEGKLVGNEVLIK